MDVADLQEGLYDYCVRGPASYLLRSTIFSGVTEPLFPNATLEERRLSNPRAIHARYMARLHAIGGLPLRLTAPSGDRIEAMYFQQASCSSGFKQLLSSFDEVSEIRHPKREESCRLFIARRDEVCQVLDPMVTFQHAKDVLESVGLIQVVAVKELPFVLGSCGYATNDIPELPEGVQEVYLMMTPEVPSDSEHRTAVICGGSGVWFSVYAPIIARLLLNGLDVMTFNYRGYGESEGTPTDKRTHQDLETAVAYLRGAGVDEKRLLLYASSMGLGPASRFVALHPGCDLIVDRSFARLHDVVAHVVSDHMGYPRIGRVVQWALPYVLNYDAISYLREEVDGNVLVVIDSDDELMDQEGQELLQSQVSVKDRRLLSHLKTHNFGHAGNWLKSPEYRAQLERFLRDTRK